MFLFSAIKLAFSRVSAGLFTGSGRGGPSRMVVIVGVGLAMIALLVWLSIANEKANIDSHVAKMTHINPLPGGLNGTPAQDALLVRHSQAEAGKATQANQSFTPPMPGSVPARPVGAREVGDGTPEPVKVASLDIRMAPVPKPTYVPPESRPEGASSPEAVIEKVSARDVEMDPEARRAADDLFNDWNPRPPRTDVVMTPATSKAVDGKADSDVTGRINASPYQPVLPRTVLVPAGRGVYAHTVVSVNSDTGGPIILEADTGPLAGDRLLGTFQKNAGDRLVVRITTVEHRGRSLEVAGFVVAPDSMETSVASAIDEHYAERFIFPAAAAFIAGLGQAVAMTNATTALSPFGGTVTQYGQLNLKQQLMVGAGAAGQSVAQGLQQAEPKGPTIILGANISVGVMFLTDVIAPKSF